MPSSSLAIGLASRIFAKKSSEVLEAKFVSLALSYDSIASFAATTPMVIK